MRMIGSKSGHSTSRTHVLRGSSTTRKEQHVVEPYTRPLKPMTVSGASGGNTGSECHALASVRAGSSSSSSNCTSSIDSYRSSSCLASVLWSSSTDEIMRAAAVVNQACTSTSTIRAERSPRTGRCSTDRSNYLAVGISIDFVGRCDRGEGRRQGGWSAETGDTARVGSPVTTQYL